MLIAGTLRPPQTYHVWGRDSFQIGSRQLLSEATYDGSETLTIEPAGGGRRYSAKAIYDKKDDGAMQKATATFISVIDRDGRERDEIVSDPEFLTILNQPFAVQLDQQTLRDVRRLSAPAPFTFTASMSGAKLEGTLRHIPDGLVAGQRVVGIGFDASGPIKGGIPAHPEISLSGTMRMAGHAYYTAADALLMELDATLEIAGTLADESARDPVKIVYRRTIRAE
jgi:hypothetical protein